MEKFWVKSKSGLYLPLGRSDSTSKKGRTSFVEVADEARKLEQLFSKYNVRLHPSSELAKLIRSAVTLGEKWEAGKKQEITMEMLCNSISLLRIVSAVLPLDGNPKAEEYLKKLSGGSLDMLKRTVSAAKNFFWEIEVWQKLLRAGLKADFEEPDVLWRSPSGTTGIACKRVYSDGNISRTLSGAVSQIEKSTGYGVVAFNLDDLAIQEGKVAKARSPEIAAAMMQELNKEFLRRHEEDFKKYFTKDRLTGALISISGITMSDMAYLNSQWFLWTHPELPEEHLRRIRELYDAVAASK